MRKDKAVAFKLRQKGKSYREIQKELNISRSTLCDWFRNEEWSTHIKKSNILENIKLGSERLRLLQDGRNKLLEDKYNKTELKAEIEFFSFKKEPLFMAGLMIYAGEGDKRSRNVSRISNSEFYLHKIFIRFAYKYLDITRENIKIALILYPDLDQEKCVKKWSEELNIRKNNFHKTQIINGKEKISKLQYGVGISIISSTVVIKKKILKWLELSKEEEF